MIFGTKLLPLVLDGRKTETRRKRGPRNVLYRAGGEYAIQPGRGKHGIGRLRVLEVREEVLNDLDDAAARREGFHSREAFERYWVELYGSIDWQQPVYAIRFEVVS